MRIDEPITAELSDGRPVSFSSSRWGTFNVLQTLGEWQAPGESRLYRLRVDSPSGPAVAEIVGPTGAHPTSGLPWKLSRIWS